MVIAELGKVKVGDGNPVVIIGAINLGEESFYKGSIVSGTHGVVQRAREMVEEGAEVIDIGAMAAGPHSKPISRGEEMRKLIPSIKAASKGVDVPISADTQRADIAEAAIECGASVVNDISGLKADAHMADVISAAGCSAILMAAKNAPGDVYGIAEIRGALMSSLKICREHNIPLKKVVVDPAIGHWPARLASLGPRAKKQVRGRKYSFATYLDLRILARLRELDIGRPMCLGISRKSFIGDFLELPNPENRLSGSLAATVIGVLNGAHVIRTHDPLQTTQAIRIAEEIRDLR
ncbi:MAG: dihydropteroate synthase [Methanobacteriota archaeon]